MVMKNINTIIERICMLGAVLGILLGYSYMLEKKNKEIKILQENNASYTATLEGEKNKAKRLQLTIDNLNYSSDTILQKLNATRKELKIKNSKLHSLLYTNTIITKTDTLVYKDTIFRDSSIQIDTLLKDKWYNVNLKLHYPSTIVCSAAFKSEKHIIVHFKKETINHSKKFFLFRLFQKKHTIVIVDVVEKNPYASDSEVRYIEILK